MTTGEIAEFLEGNLFGDKNILIRGVSGIEEAKKGEITFLANPRYYHLINSTLASAIIVSRGFSSIAGKTIIQVDNPSLAFARITAKFSPTEYVHPKGIHPTAIIAKSAKIGKSVAIDAYTILEENTVIGDNTIIYPICYIGRNTTIGKNTLIYANVSIREGVSIGNRVVIQSGAVVGSDGFGFLTKGNTHKRIPQTGTVVIEDDVEIGANVTIDRARFDKTVIGKGTKIDNLVQIAHNVVIGKNCIIVAQVGISGSSAIGNNVTLAGQAGIAGHINIGDKSIVMGQSAVTKSIAPETTVWGNPAKPASIAKRINACVQNLPRLYKTVSEIKKMLNKKKK